MNGYYIISFLSLLFIALGITFAILKSNNDEKIKLNPEIENNVSGIYLALSIIFFVLFFICTCFAALLYIFLKNKTVYLSPKFAPLLEGGYNTSPEGISDDTTPQQLKLSSSINKEIRKTAPFPDLLKI